MNISVCQWTEKMACAVPNAAHDGETSNAQKTDRLHTFGATHQENSLFFSRSNDKAGLGIAQSDARGVVRTLFASGGHIVLFS
jgi:hypothetical protein